DARYRVASATAAVNAARNTTMNTATGIVAPAPLVTTVCRGRQKTDASASAAGTPAATAARSSAPPAAEGAVSDRIMRRPPDVPRSPTAPRGARPTPSDAAVPSRGSATAPG